MTDTSISPLRQRMIEDMTVRGFTAGTQRSYITAVRGFTAFFGRFPDQATAEDLRRYQLHMRSSGATATSMNAAVSALRFLFGVPSRSIAKRSSHSFAKPFRKNGKTSATRCQTTSAS